MASICRFCITAGVKDDNSEMDDAELLRRYADQASEPAFTEFVQRHVDMVYATALRHVGGNSHTARDATQIVFTDAARKAAQLCRHSSITGWLYTSTRFAATKLVRAAIRRELREKAAQLMQDLTRNEQPEISPDALRRVLDDAMHDLNAADRDAILLRYFEKKTFAEVGIFLKVGEDAARRRLDRALSRLREHLIGRGINSTTAVLAVALAEQAAIAAPVGLGASISAQALAATASTAAGGLGAFHLITMSKLSVGIVGALVLTGAFMVYHRGADRRALVETQSSANRPPAIQTQDARPKNLVSTAKSEPTNRLREPVTNDVNPAGDPIPSTSEHSRTFSMLSAINAGSETPIASYRTLVWAVTERNVDQIAAAICFSPEASAKLDAFFKSLPLETQAQYGSPEKVIATVMASKLPAVESVGVLKQEQSPSGDVSMTLLISVGPHPKLDAIESSIFHRTPSGWKTQIDDDAVDRDINLLSGGAPLTPGSKPTK
jgi:RNA polymerase sigma factor (sigma-70 family)